jgi:hypothetical protein
MLILLPASKYVLREALQGGQSMAGPAINIFSLQGEKE